jgi:hypothetical protein
MDNHQVNIEYVYKRIPFDCSGDTDRGDPDRRHQVNKSYLRSSPQKREIPMSNKKECPGTGSTSHFILNLAMIALGAAGLYFLNIWIAVAYVAFFFVYFFVIMPVKACQYCYYRTDVPLEEWKDKYLDVHATSMKMWGSGIFIIWLTPIIQYLRKYTFLVS